MIDNASLLVFGLAILYTVFRALRLDKLIPWFAPDSEAQLPPPEKKKFR
jgi:hypothetical protein